MTQSSPMRAPGPITTLACTIVRAPTDAPAPMVTNGPTDASAAIVASGATSLSALTPGAGRPAGANNATARAKAEYGSSARRTAHGAVGAPLAGPRITADARVVASCGRYRLLAT